VRLSKKKLKYIRRHAARKSPEEIAKALDVPLKVVKKALSFDAGFVLDAPRKVVKKALPARRDASQSKPPKDAEPPEERLSADAETGEASFPSLVERFLARAPYWGVFALVVAAPFMVVPGLRDYSNLPKSVFVQLGALALVFVWLVGSGIREDCRLARTSLDLPLLAFIGWATVSLIWGHNTYEALLVWSRWAAAGLVFLLTVNVVRGRRDVRVLLWGLLGSAAVVALVGIWQYLLEIGRNPPPFPQDFLAQIWYLVALYWIPQSQSPAASFGNPNFAAQYVVLAMPLCAGLFLTARTRAGEWLAALACSLMGVYLLHTSTKACWVAVGVEVAFVAALLLEERLSLGSRCSKVLRSLGLQLSGTLRRYAPGARDRSALAPGGDEPPATRDESGAAAKTAAQTRGAPASAAAPIDRVASGSSKEPTRRGRAASGSSKEPTRRGRVGSGSSEEAARHGRRWNRTAALVSAAILALVLANLTPKGFIWRLGGLYRQMSVLWYRPDDTGKDLSAPASTHAEADYRGSIHYRYILWGNTLEMLKDHPVLGVGIGNWRVRYVGYSSRYALDTGVTSKRQPGRAHNDHLQVLAELGLVGLALYLWLGYAVYRAIVRALARGKERETRYLAMAVAAGVVGILVDASFSLPFQLAVPPLIVMTYLAVLGGVLSPGMTAMLEGPPVSHRSAARARSVASDAVLTRLPVWAFYSAAPVVATLFVLHAWMQRSRIIADWHFRKMDFASVREDWKKVIDEGSKASRYDTRRKKTLVTVAGGHIRRVKYEKTLEAKRGKLENAVELLKEVVGEYPCNLKAYNHLGVAYMEIAELERKVRSSLFRADRSLRSDLESGRLSDRFLRRFKDCRVSLSGNVAISREKKPGLWRISDLGTGRTYFVEDTGERLKVFVMKASPARKGALGASLAYFERALEVRPEYADVHCNLASVYDKLDKPDEAVWSLGRALWYDRENPMLLKNMAIAWTKRKTGPLLFGAPLSLRSDLLSGRLSEPFLRRFKDHGVSLSKRITVKREREVEPWRINDLGTGRTYFVEETGKRLKVYAKNDLDKALFHYRRAVEVRTPLFGAPLSLRGDLAKGRLSKPFLRRFKDRRVALSDSIAIRREKEPGLWRVSDLVMGRTYFVQETSEVLRVYVKKDDASIYRAIADIHKSRGEVPEARRNYDKALFLYKRALEARSFLFAADLNLRGDLARGHLSGPFLRGFEGRRFPLSNSIAIRREKKPGSWRISDLVTGRTYFVVETDEVLKVYVKKDDARVYGIIAGIHMSRGEAPEALHNYRFAAKFNPQNATYHHELGVSAFHVRRYREAGAAFRNALRLRPGWALAHKNLGMVQIRFLGEKDEGIGHLKDALRLNPKVAGAANVRRILRDYGAAP
jgi:tetratricopeptide (TPR) repeat protein